MDLEKEFKKWYFLIALAHIDSKLMREEQEFLRMKIEKYAPEGFHRRLFQEMFDDLLTPRAPDFDFYNRCTPEDKIEILNLAHMLFWSDDDIDDREAAILDSILSHVKKDPKTLSLLKTTMDEWANDKSKQALKTYVKGRV